MLLEIGHIGRPHGLRGDLLVRLVTNREGRLVPGSQVDCAGRCLTVRSSRPVPGRQGGHSSSWLVSFEGVATREDAEQMTGAVLCVPAETGDGDGLWVHELIGSVVREREGADRGRVIAVQANPASDLLVLDDGALVPLRFVVAVHPGVLVIDPPPGLFDL